MLANRGQWLRHLAPDLSREKLERSLRQTIKHLLEQVAEAFPAEFRDDTVELVRFAAENLRNEGCESPISACYKLRALPDAAVESLPYWLGIAEMFLTKDGQRRRNPTKKEGFPAGKVWQAAKLNIAMSFWTRGSSLYCMSYGSCRIHASKMSRGTPWWRWQSCCMRQ